MTKSTSSVSNSKSKLPFSFDQIFAQKQGVEQARPDSETVVASDGVELSVAVYEPNDNVMNEVGIAFVFYHGGGAHSGAGYQDLARNLSQVYGIAVYLPDIRGHGNSGGPRGDSPSKEQVWMDVDSVLEFVTARRPQTKKLYLGGHSSGGGLVVNYATVHKAMYKLSPIAGYILVAPELGYKSETARPNRTDFASVSLAPFIFNAIFGILGHSKAVRFHYPPDLLESDPGMVGFNTVNMANAITPEGPLEQMKQLSEGPPPLGLWVGAEDELFVPEKVTAYIETKGPKCSKNIAEIVSEKNHLGIVVGIHQRIGNWITQQD